MVVLHHYYKLVEKNSSKVNKIWRVFHITLYFFVFGFGALCSVGFHWLMYAFDENCVLSPRVIHLTRLRRSNIVRGITTLDMGSDDIDKFYISTQWSEPGVCFLPVYIPLLSAIYGLVWAALFLMCSSGGRSITGLARPWRVLPPALLFSAIMAVLSVFASAATDDGLGDLSAKLHDIRAAHKYEHAAGNDTIQTVIRITVITSWLNTLCWFATVALVLARMLLAVDFQLVHIQVKLHADMDRVLEKYEKQIYVMSGYGTPSRKSSHLDIQKEADDKNYSTKVHFKHKSFFLNNSESARSVGAKSTKSESGISKSGLRKTKSAVSMNDLASPPLDKKFHIHSRSVNVRLTQSSSSNEELKNNEQKKYKEMERGRKINGNDKIDNEEMSKNKEVKKDERIKAENIENGLKIIGREKIRKNEGNKNNKSEDGEGPSSDSSSGSRGTKEHMSPSQYNASSSSSS